MHLVLTVWYNLPYMLQLFLLLYYKCTHVTTVTLTIQNQKMAKTTPFNYNILRHQLIELYHNFYIL